MTAKTLATTDHPSGRRPPRNTYVTEKNSDRDHLLGRRSPTRAHSAVVARSFFFSLLSFLFFSFHDSLTRFYDASHCRSSVDLLPGGIASDLAFLRWAPFAGAASGAATNYREFGRLQGVSRAAPTLPRRRRRRRGSR